MSEERKRELEKVLKDALEVGTDKKYMVSFIGESMVVEQENNKFEIPRERWMYGIHRKKETIKDTPAISLEEIKEKI